ncbi:hypothetical protein APHNP_0107 [Anaplasma phagocytophilum str. ApNP]|uniref:Uncharacterized protein n=1 Tax=Anaplasma phagocytophilum str. ApNP TaxID=1359153 RepID=A0A0F3NL58_ANAPH|nr:hypothetical protein APHNP_0107 [Anaplasma phagocytophilum str. ApNP]
MQYDAKNENRANADKIYYYVKWRITELFWESAISNSF